MRSLLAEPAVISSLIAFSGVLMSVVLSWSTGRRQVRAALETHEQTIASKYEEKSLEQRMIKYQELWSSLATLSKNGLDAAFKEARMVNYIYETQLALNAWYERNGILLSKQSYSRFYGLRRFLAGYLKKLKFDNPADLAMIRRRRWHLQQALRADIYVEPIQA